MYNYFPTSYQPYQYQPQYAQSQQNTQQYTPPTIKDDKYIFIKTAYANSPAQIVRYTKGEPEPPVEYVTREELDRRLNGIIEKFKPKKQEAVKNGSVQ